MDDLAWRSWGKRFTPAGRRRCFSRQTSSSPTTERIDAKGVREHAFFTKYDWDDVLNNKVRMANPSLNAPAASKALDVMRTCAI